MQHVRSHGFGSLTPADSLADVVAVFRAARDWSCEVDESLRQAGCTLDDGILGMPLAQVDVILVILDREQATLQAALVALAAAERTLATAQRHRRVARRYALGCGLLTLVNVACCLVWWWF